MDIPYQELNPETLRGIIEDFVLREGTDYGHQDYTLDQKIKAVEKQLERGLAKIVYDPEDETCSIVRVGQ